MNNIAGISYTAARFDKDGAALSQQEVTLPQGTTDVIVASHGWNNTEEQAEQLYKQLFTSFAAVASDQLQNKKIAIVGVIWPSKKFTDVVDAAVAEQARGGSAGFGTSSAAADGSRYGPGCGRPLSDAPAVAGSGPTSTAVEERRVILVRDARRRMGGWFDHLRPADDPDG